MNSQLLNLLNESVSNGRFYATGTFSIPDLTLEIDKLGALPVPITAENARRIIGQCSQAPYGRGHETLVDTSVRNVRELAPEIFTIASDEWQAQLAKLVQEVGTQLGLEDQNISAQPDKLLVYEKGSFFVAHQDTEKAPGMFASLVIALPSQHTGGTLIVSHQGEDKKISFGGKKSDSLFQYAAFYTDCRHEIKPITGGYRICLTYHLCLAQKTAMPLSAQNAVIAQRIADLLKEWSDDLDEPEKKVILFEHQYTPAGFSLTNLKNSDYVHGEILSQAARQARCEVHLALLTFHQNGLPENDYDAYNDYHGRRRYYDDYDDEEDEDEDFDDDDDIESGENHEMGEVFDEDLEITQWFSTDGREKAMGSISLVPSEIIAATGFTDNDPDESEYEGFMGNYGPSLDRWYHRAALIIWPEKFHYYIVVQAGPAGSVPELAALTAKMQQASGPEKATLLASCRALALAIIHYGNFVSQENNPPILLMLEILPALEDTALAEDFFRTIFSQLFYGDEGTALAGFLDTLGWDNFAQELTALYERDKGPAYKMMRLLNGLQASVVPAKKRDILKALADRVSRYIRPWDKANPDGYQFYSADMRNETSQQRIFIIRSVIEDCSALFTTEALNELILYFTSREKYYPLHEVLIPLLQHYGKAVADHAAPTTAVGQFVQTVVDILKEHTRAPIQIPTHWRMPVSWPCDCQDCRMLKEFLKNPDEKTLPVKMAKDRRRHMHGIVEQYVPDLTHETIRRGSPLTLVFEKNRNSYGEKQRRWQKELDVLNDYQALTRTADSTRTSP